MTGQDDFTVEVGSVLKAACIKGGKTFYDHGRKVVDQGVEVPTSDGVSVLADTLRETERKTSAGVKARFSIADGETAYLVSTVMERDHPELFQAGLSVQVLLAGTPVDEDGTPTGPAISVNGYPAVAKVKILGLEARVRYGFDAELTLDADEWEVCSREQQEAIVDHELTHLELRTDREGSILYDDAERPKLKMRKHDRQFGWFDEVARRHGEASVEVRQCREMLEDQAFKQGYLFDMAEV
jgi:hypothetical protein